MENPAIWDFRDPYAWMERVSKNTLPPLMVSVALTGGVHGKEANPNLPETVDEQVEAAYQAWQAGAVSAHIHIRDPENTARPVNDEALFSKVNEGIRKRCPGMIVNNSTSGGADQTAYQKVAAARAECKPDMCSLNPGPFMYIQKNKARIAPVPFPAEASEKDVCTPITYGDITFWGKTLKEDGIRPEIEIFNNGQFWSVNHLIKQGLIEPPYVLQYVMGFQTGTYPSPANVINLIDNTPAGAIFFIPGMGVYQLPMNVLAILLGGHVRVGLEDNVYYKKGELAKSAAQQVERIRRIAEEMNRPFATTAEARQMLGLAPA